MIAALPDETATVPGPRARASPAVSYGELDFMVAGTCFAKGVLAIERKRFLQSLAQAFEQLFAGALLTVNAGHLLDPADPPLAVLLQKSGIFAAHYSSGMPCVHGPGAALRPMP